MKVFFDQGTPAPLRHSLVGYEVSTSAELGWSNVANGELLRRIEGNFEIFITTDQNLCHQQNLSGRQLAILVLPFASWPKLQRHLPEVIAAVAALQPGDYVELEFS